MTIAAGFLHRDGVLLCADTQQETWALKFYGSKVGYFDCYAGKVAYAFAGNSDFAAAAILGCEKRLKKISSGDPAEVAQKFLDKEYRRVVFGNPNQANDPTLHYWFLLAFYIPGQLVRLYATNQVAMQPISSYRCLGIGDTLATHLIRPTFDTALSERQALHLAAYALTIVKRDVPGCGGSSMFLSLRNDGSVKEIYNDPVVSQFEKHLGGYNMLTQQLLWLLTDVVGLSDSDFEINLHLFDQQILEIRREWSAARRAREAKFRALNPNYDGPDPREV
jgi:hypothetical protein